PKRTPTEQLLSQIDGHLYLSGMFPVRETPETLRALGIKHILTLRREPVPKFRQLSEITYKFIAVDDTRNQDMLGNDLLENCLRFLHNTIEVRKESTLVHCEMGMSRSAMVVIAFLMRKYRMTVNDALAMVRACRDIVQPNVSFMTQLNIFAEMNYSANFFALSRCETYHEWCLQTKNVCLRSDTFEHTVAKVEEGLYVGSRADATMRRSYLRHVGITHLLTVSSEHIEIDEAFDGLHHKFVYLHEHRREDILGGGILDHCTRFISAAIEVGGKVLVHCDGSFNRCLPIAAAYLIRHQNWDMVKVKNLLREHYTFGSESPDSKEGLILQLSFLVKLKGRTDDESLRSFLPYLCWLAQSGNTVRFKSLMGGVEPNVRYNCLICGCLLFRDNHIIRHYRSMDGKMCGMRYQINAPDWIVRENDIAFCPECGVDVGNFCPLGYECRMIGCGRVVPNCLNVHEVCVAISSISS
uniref:protein-tyrosine-phosphatase n=1 Tax=Plectus sambesii TaxID=2011161 RepID=A0A914XH38_9BILA